MRFRLSRSRRVHSRVYWSVVGVPGGDYAVIERVPDGRDYWLTIQPVTYGESRGAAITVLRADSLRQALALAVEVYS